MSPVCIMMIGMPASGKSTFADSFISFSYDKCGRYPALLSTDNIVEEIASLFNVTYDFAWKDTINFATRIMNKELDKVTSSNSSFIVDRTNLTKSSRACILNRLPNHYRKVAVDMNHYASSLNIDWHRRLESRPGKNIPADVLEKMAKNYQCPTLAEFDAFYDSGYDSNLCESLYEYIISDQRERVDIPTQL